MMLTTTPVSAERCLQRRSVAAKPCLAVKPCSAMPARPSPNCAVPVMRTEQPLVQGPSRRQAGVACSSSATPAAAPTGKLISSTEVPVFIQRDDIIDQLYQWAQIEAGEGGFRNFGMPMTVDPVFKNEVLWGFNVGIFKDGVKLTDIGVGFDGEASQKHEWLGKGKDGFPTLEGRVDDVMGKNIEIWKLDMNPVSEDLRSTLRGFCTGLVGAINRYYAFGSVFVDDERG